MAAKRKSSDQHGNEVKVGDEKPYRVGYGRPPHLVQAQPVGQSERTAAAPFAGAQP
jgi:hypothetical protein